MLMFLIQKFSQNYKRNFMTF